MVAIAKSTGAGWVDYKWVHPITKHIMQKSAYLERVDEIIIGCGCYK
jgi:signal transduction histidine kinase